MDVAAPAGELGSDPEVFRLSDLWNLAGLLTVARIPMAGFFPAVIDHPPGGLLLYLLGFGTDVLDGLVARRTGTVSKTGAYVDGVSDKLFHAVVAGTMVAHGTVPAWWLLAWFSREIAHILLIPWFIAHTRDRAPRTRIANWFGKSTTGALAGAIVLALAGVGSAALVVTLLCGALGLVATASYVAREYRPCEG